MFEPGGKAAIECVAAVAAAAAVGCRFCWLAAKAAGSSCMAAGSAAALTAASPFRPNALAMFRPAFILKEMALMQAAAAAAELVSEDGKS